MFNVHIKVELAYILLRSNSNHWRYQMLSENPIYIKTIDSWRFDPWMLLLFCSHMALRMAKNIQYSTIEIYLMLFDPYPDVKHNT